MQTRPKLTIVLSLIFAIGLAAAITAATGGGILVFVGSAFLLVGWGAVGVAVFRTLCCRRK